MNISNHLLTSLAAAAMTLTAFAAQPEIFQLGTANTIVRITEPGKFLILPVQESTPDKKVDILVNGKIEQTIFVRLADSNVDYTVPLDLTPYTEKGEVVLNIVSEVDRAHSRQASDFVCWEAMEIADTFDTTNTEKYRPTYHHTPLYGWMNDPNGMFYKDGVWHLYYQYNPYGSKWQNMNWGHSSTTDLVHWNHHPVAIEPDGLGTIFSGSSVVDAANTAGFGDSTVVALYTACSASQIQNLAYSLDGGMTFTKYPGNPVIPNRDEARDPNMFWHEPTHQWVLVLAHALEHEIQFYTSPNLIDWTLQSSFGKGYGAQDGVWECPDLFELEVEGTGEKKWVLIVNINPGGPMGGSAAQYFVGDFDGKTFTPGTDASVAKWMDWGKDHYATVSWSNAPENRRTVIGWMSNWQYANDVPTQQYRSANTLPRDLGLFRCPDGDLYLTVVPSPELIGLRGVEKSYGKATIGSTPRQFAIPDLCEIELSYDLQGCDKLDLVLSNEAGEKAVMTIDGKAREFSMDRTQSGITNFSAHFPAVTTAPMLSDSAKGSLRIFIDKNSIEVFDGKGRFAMTNLVFPTEPYNSLAISANGGRAKIEPLKVFKIK